MTKRIWTAGGALGAALLAGGMAAMQLSATTAGAFDAETWRAQRGSTDHRNPRHAMLAEVRKRVLRPGMARAEVQAVLGAPERGDARSDRYALGASLYGIDHEYLIIEYDTGGHLAATRIVRG
jgi:hypothetical protein